MLLGWFTLKRLLLLIKSSEKRHQHSSQDIIKKKKIFLSLSFSLAAFHGNSSCRARFANPIYQRRENREDSNDMCYPGLQEIHAVPAFHIRRLDLFLK